ncbi:MAG: sortase [Candidatus Paceibacterota bacterium]|jgi:LPXTG-site transpeptidase (sortase) family protein
MKKINTFLLAALLCFFFVIGNNANAASFTFSRNLTIGSRGNDVLALQQFLIVSGLLNITIPTNYFGLATKTALTKWQASVGIAPTTGTLGPLSRGKLNIVIQQPMVDTPSVPATISTTSAAANPVIAKTNNGLPIRIAIPKINVDAKFQYNGLASDGTMEIPNNVIDVGWFTGSVHPGEKGVAIVTGHVAQIRGGVLTKPGVFKNLSELRAGDRLYVTNDKKETITFVVRESHLYDPAADATSVFTSGDNGSHLNLITCEGTWNSVKQSYSQRLVIFTDALQ